MKLLKEKVVDSDILRKILNLTQDELLNGLERSALNTNVTVGGAIFSLYKMARGIKVDGRVIIKTQQTFLVDRKSISPDSILATLALEEKEIVVPEDVMGSLAASSYIDTVAPWNRIFIKNLLSAKVESFPTLDLGIPEDFYPGYLVTTLLEDDMRENMYVDEDPDYYQPHYGLQEVTEDFIKSLPFGNRKPRHENTPKFSNHLLFPYQSAVPRSEVSRKQIINFFNYLLDGEKNLFIAGGSVESTLFQSTTGDLDLFVHGTDEEEALNIVRRVVDKLNPETVLRTVNAITLTNCELPREYNLGVSIVQKKDGPPHDYNTTNFFRRIDVFKVQIILRLYKTPSEVLHGFDVDSCCVGYDGKKFWATERAMYAFKHSTNTVNFGRLSPSYEYRLVKYAARGFGIYVPKLDGNRVDRKLLQREYSMSKWELQDKEIKGLSILLLYNEKVDPDRKNKKGNPARKPFKNLVRRTPEEKSDYAPYKTTGMTLEDFVVFSSEVTSVKLPREYKNVYINSLIEAEDQATEVTFIRASSDKLEEILDIDERVVKLAHELSPLTTFVLPLKTEWKTTNPGEQMTNTFHQIVLQNNEEWYKGRYYH